MNCLNELVIEKKWVLERTVITNPEQILYDLVDLGKTKQMIKLQDKIIIDVQGQIIFDLTDANELKTIFNLNPR